ncbi:hypothetical protein D3C84_787470 [compost metagenome]
MVDRTLICWPETRLLLIHADPVYPFRTLNLSVATTTLTDNGLDIHRLELECVLAVPLSPRESLAEIELVWVSLHQLHHLLQGDEGEICSNETGFCPMNAEGPWYGR